MFVQKGQRHHAQLQAVPLALQATAVKVNQKYILVIFFFIQPECMLSLNACTIFYSLHVPLSVRVTRCLMIGFPRIKKLLLLFRYSA